MRHGRAKAATVVLAGLWAPGSVCPAQSPDTGERHALAALAEALRAGRIAGERIWPDFDISRIPIALYRRGGSVLLVQHPSPPAGFEPLDTDLLPIPVHRGPHGPAFTANTAIRFAGAVTACIDRASMGGEALRPEDVGLIVHETTHAFQGRAPEGGAGRWPQENAALVAAYPRDDPDNNAWIQIESVLLAEALQKPDPEPIARDFLAVRRHRQALLPAALREFERRLECNEGLAEYAAYRALALAAEDGGPAREGPLTPDALAGYRGRLLRRLAADQQVGRGGRRQRFYQSGAAQALLLDRLAVEDWKRRIEGGATLQEILASELESTDSERSRRLQTVAAEHGFDERREREELMARALGSQRRAAMLDLLAGEGTKVVLDLSRCGGAGGVRFFDPMNLVVIDGGLRLHTRMLEL